jgi:S-DNA-T family DNA segregation ATPase FtsK/SpoIIIE
VIIREGRGSVSLLQRALGVGYGRGARLIDFMAEDGIVGEYKGSQAREVLLTMEEWAARNGSDPLPPDPPPRKLKIQPHAGEAATPQVEADEDEAGDDWGEEAPQWAEDEGDWDEGDEGAESDEDTDEAADSDDDEEFEEDAEDEEDEAEYESEEDEATDDFGSENDVPAPDAADSPRCR